MQHTPHTPPYIQHCHALGRPDPALTRHSSILPHTFTPTPHKRTWKPQATTQGTSDCAALSQAQAPWPGCFVGHRPCQTVNASTQEHIMPSGGGCCCSYPGTAQSRLPAAPALLMAAHSATAGLAPATTTGAAGHHPWLCRNTLPSDKAACRALCTTPLMQGVCQVVMAVSLP